MRPSFRAALPLSAILGLVALLFACSPSPGETGDGETTAGCRDGAEGCPCPDAGCDAGLSCLGGLCAPAPAGSSSTSVGTSDGEATGAGETTSTSTSAADTTNALTEATSASDTECDFICATDMPCDAVPGLDGQLRCSVSCDVFLQDCPDGEKCVPYDTTGNNSFDSVKCVPVDDDPGVAGDPCSTEGIQSGIDTCAAGHICHYLNQDNEGICVAQCTGSPDNPSCPDPDDVCTIVNGGVLTPCRPSCDPLLQDCDLPIDVACLPTSGTDRFACIPDASADAGAYQDPCEFINGCDPGNYCADAQSVPGCEGDKCCTPFCDLTEDPSPCPEGTECTPWYEDGQAPPEYMNVGGCVILQP